VSPGPLSQARVVGPRREGDVGLRSRVGGSPCAVWSGRRRIWGELRGSEEGRETARLCAPEWIDDGGGRHQRWISMMGPWPRWFREQV